MSLLARVLRLCEALEDGDLVFVRQGLDDLATDLRRAELPRRPVCPYCPGLTFDWPGELQEHLRVHHPEAREASDAA